MKRFSTNRVQNPRLRGAYGAAWLCVAVAVAGGLAGCGSPYAPGTVSESFSPPDTPQSISNGEGYITMSDGVDLYYHAVGRSTNVLVLHGGPGLPYPAPWPVAESLDDDFRFVFFDQRGSGRSDRPIDRLEGSGWRRNAAELNRTLGLARNLADIESFRRALGDRPIVVVGHSYGAFLATLYAAEFPDYVERLVLIAPANVVVMPNAEFNIYDAIRRDLDPSIHVEYDRWLEELFDYRDLWSRDEQEHAELNNGLLRFASALSPSVAIWGAESEVDPALTGGWIQAALFLSLGRRYDLRDHLNRITAPTTIFVGSADRFVGDHADGVLLPYLDSIHNRELVVLDGAGHFPFMDANRFSDHLSRAIGPDL